MKITLCKFSLETNVIESRDVKISQLNCYHCRYAYSPLQDLDEGEMEDMVYEGIGGQYPTTASRHKDM